MTRSAVGLMLVVLPIALGAQQPPKPPQTQAPAKPPASTSTTAFPAGTYVVTMQDGSIIQVAFADGAYHATQDGKPIATGKYTTKGDQIVVSDNSDACGMSGEGTYTWAFDGKALTFKGSKDGCDTRLQIMTGYPFVKK